MFVPFEILSYRYPSITTLPTSLYYEIPAISPTQALIRLANFEEHLLQAHGKPTNHLIFTHASTLDLFSVLPANEYRYVFWRDVQSSKRFFFLWSPDKAKIKDKMISASCKGEVCNHFAVHTELSYTDFEETDNVLEAIRNTINKT